MTSKLEARVMTTKPKNLHYNIKGQGKYGTEGVHSYSRAWY